MMSLEFQEKIQVRLIPHVVTLENGMKFVGLGQIVWVYRIHKYLMLNAFVGE